MKAAKLPWTTRLPDEQCRIYGVQELHAVVYVPQEDDDGSRDTVSLMIPESATAVRPAMQFADRERLRVLLVCDTRKQAKRVAAEVVALLPRHRRVPLEKVERCAFGRGH